MHCDAQQRYQSVEALIRDIDHYLRGEPLEARPDSLRYRGSKFVTRNRRPVIAACAGLLLVATLIAFFTLRLAKARDAALAEAARTERLQEFMSDMLEGGDEEMGPAEDLRVVTVLDRGLKKAEALRGDPASQANLYQTLGGVYEALGKFDQANSLLSLTLERMKAIYGRDSKEAGEAMLRLASLRYEQDELTEAERLIRESLAINRRHLQPDHPMIGMGLNLLGMLLEKRGRYDEAIETLNQAVRIQSTRPGEENHMYDSLTNLANAHFYLGHYATSYALNQRILAWDKQVHGERYPGVAADYLNLGNIEDNWGHYAAAERYYLQALAILQAWFGKDHLETADAMSYVAKTLVSQGQYDEAESLLDPALVTFEHAFGKKPHHQVAMVLSQLGTIALKRGQLDEAETDFTRMGEIYRIIYGENHQNVGSALSDLAGVYLERKQYARAEGALRDAIGRFSRTLPPGHLKTGIARVKLGRALLGEKRYEEAERESLAGYEIVSKQSSPIKEWLVAASVDLVAEYSALREPEKAAKFRTELTANEPVALVAGSGK